MPTVTGDAIDDAVNMVLEALLRNHGGMTGKFQIKRLLTELNSHRREQPRLDWTFLFDVLAEQNLIYAHKRDDEIGEPADILFLIDSGWDRLRQRLIWEEPAVREQLVADVFGLARAIVYPQVRRDCNWRVDGPGQAGLGGVLLKYLEAMRIRNQSDDPAPGVHHVAQVLSLLALSQHEKLLRVVPEGTQLVAKLPQRLTREMLAPILERRAPDRPDAQVISIFSPR
jgi:hypothetical protein